MDTDRLQEAYQQGYEYERCYHGCAQCAIGALYEVFPEWRNEDIFRAASGLGGGVGLTCRGHCGALSGGVMVLSQVFGRQLQEIDDPLRKRARAFQLGERLLQKFLDEYGTVICEEIQERVMGKGFRLNDPRDKKEFEERGGHVTACPGVVGRGVQWTTEILLEETAKE